jgi:hypothetical protein
VRADAGYRRKLWGLRQAVNILEERNGFAALDQAVGLLINDQIRQ